MKEKGFLEVYMLGYVSALHSLASFSVYVACFTLNSVLNFISPGQIGFFVFLFTSVSTIRGQGIIRVVLVDVAAFF